MFRVDNETPVNEKKHHVFNFQGRNEMNGGVQVKGKNLLFLELFVITFLITRSRGKDAEGLVVEYKW